MFETTLGDFSVMDYFRFMMVMMMMIIGVCAGDSSFCLVYVDNMANEWN